MNTPRIFTAFTDLFRRLSDKGAPASSKVITVIVIVAIMLLIAAGLLALLALLFQALWGWVIPDLFPQAVAQGTLSGEISWWTAFKVLVFLAIFGSLFRGSSHTTKTEKVQPVLMAAGEPGQPPSAPNPHVFPTLVDPLTDRELEVLTLLGKGLTNQQIAAAIDLSESTVVYHIGHIFGKLRVNSRVEAAVWAKEHGII